MTGETGLCYQLANYKKYLPLLLASNRRHFEDLSLVMIHPSSYRYISLIVH
jgi:hypothetical protein